MAATSAASSELIAISSIIVCLLFLVSLSLLHLLTIALKKQVYDLIVRPAVTPRENTKTKDLLSGDLHKATDWHPNC